MKRWLSVKNLIYAALFITGALALNSCVVYSPANMASVPVDDIVRMSKEGVPSKNIIRQLRSSHSVYYLSADQLAKLSGEGVQDSVINYMERTHINAVRNQQRMNDSYYGYYGGYPYYDYGFGWPYGYMGWGFAPTVVIRGGFGGGMHHPISHGDRR